MKLLFDIETDGLLDTVSTVWCLVIKDLETGQTQTFTQPEGNILEGVRLLDKAELLAGHNILGFDIPALRKLYPSARLNPSVLRDTLIISQLVYSDIKSLDFAMADKWGMPAFMRGRHGLPAWGYRLGCHKGDYSDWCKDQGLDPWDRFRPEMLDYCVQDVELNYRLFLALAKKKPPRAAVDLEMECAKIIRVQEENGFAFDIDKAVKLYAELAAKREELRQEVQGLFKPWFRPVGQMTVKRSMRRGVPESGKIMVTPIGKNGKPLKPREEFNVYEERTEGDQFTAVELTEFNPSSRDHIADRIRHLYGWKPTQFTKEGKAQVDDDILSELPFPPCKLLAEYFLIEKRVGMLAEGRQAWMKKAVETEVHGVKALRIHGRVDTVGTVTFRAAHKDPNMGQVPSAKAPYGPECRDLFGTVLAKLLGTDASGLELRALAHHMQPYDDGEYVRAVVEGDVHWTNAQALGLIKEGTVKDDHNPEHIKARGIAKTFIYAFLYGGGGYKLGITVGGPDPEEVAAAADAKGNPLKYALLDLERRGLPSTTENIATSIKGSTLKRNFLKGLPALKALLTATQDFAKEHGYVMGLDGRRVPIRSAHAAPNSLLQSDGAIICKAWMVNLHGKLAAAGLKNGIDYMQSAWVHDELQIQVREEIADALGQMSLQAIKEVGEHFGYRCPLAGEFKIGRTWAETH